MRNPAAKLHKPVEALRRLQTLAGAIRSADSDRNPNRDAQIDDISRQMFDICLAALSGGPLPPPRDYKDAV